MEQNSNESLLRKNGHILVAFFSKKLYCNISSTTWEDNPTWPLVVLWGWNQHSEHNDTRVIDTI